MILPDNFGLDTIIDLMIRDRLPVFLLE